MATARTKCISTKVTADEYALFARAAREQTVSGWARDVLVATAIVPSLDRWSWPKSWRSGRSC